MSLLTLSFILSGFERVPWALVGLGTLSKKDTVNHYSDVSYHFAVSIVSS